MEEYGPTVPCPCKTRHRDFFLTTNWSLRWLRGLITEFVQWDHVELQNENNRLQKVCLESREQIAEASGTKDHGVTASRCSKSKGHAHTGHMAKENRL